MGSWKKSVNKCNKYSMGSMKLRVCVIYLWNILTLYVEIVTTKASYRSLKWNFPEFMLFLFAVLVVFALRCQYFWMRHYEHK